MGTSIPRAKTQVMSAGFVALNAYPVLTSRSNPLDPVQESVDVVEQLGNNEMSSGVNFLGQEVDIGFRTVRIHMRGRIACNGPTIVSGLFCLIGYTDTHPLLLHRTSPSILDLCIVRDPPRIRNPVLLPQLPSLPYLGHREVRYRVPGQDGIPPSVEGLGMERGTSSAFCGWMNGSRDSHRHTSS
jgi:hypothetical protein